MNFERAPFPSGEVPMSQWALGDLVRRFRVLEPSGQSKARDQVLAEMRKRFEHRSEWRQFLGTLGFG